MVFNNYKNTNNATSKLAAGISASDTSFPITPSEGAIFPSTFPFLIEVEQIDSSSTTIPKPVIKREGMLVTNRVGDVFTVTRGQMTVVQDDTAIPKVASSTARSFDAGDFVSLYVAAEDIADMKDQIATGAQSNLVHRTTAETLDGLKTFVVNPQIDTYAIPTADEEFTPKKYVDDQIAFASAPFIFGDGSDGALVVASGTVAINYDQIYNYSSVSISAGATLTGTGVGSQLLIKCNGIATIDGDIDVTGANAGISGGLAYNTYSYQGSVINGILESGQVGVSGSGGNGGDANTGIGGLGGIQSLTGHGGGGGGGSGDSGNENGGDGGDGGYPGGTGGAAVSGSGTDPGLPGGDSAGGSGGQAGNTSVSGAGGDAYGNNGGDAFGGSPGGGINNRSGGGGAAGGDKGAFGGIIALYAVEFAGTGNITSDGQAGFDGGDGGDGATDPDGTAAAAGGGGSGGGGGGGGGGVLDLVGYTNSFSGTTSVVGGVAGSAGAVGLGANGGNNGSAGANGSSGNSGTIRNLQLKDII